MYHCFNLQSQTTKKMSNLTTDQQEAYNFIVNENRSLLLTGAAGTGKSYLIHRIVDALRTKGLRVQKLAFTGTAAKLIGGRTIHSYLGIGLAKQPAEDLFMKTLRVNPKIITQLRSVNWLIIDEISMISSDFFEKINLYLRFIRSPELIHHGGDKWRLPHKPLMQSLEPQRWPPRHNQVFGGIQVVLTGDLFQIPPIQGDYLFVSPVFKNLQIHHIDLRVNMRQQYDNEFQDILNEVRYGTCSDETLAKLQALSKTQFTTLKPTRLFAKNRNVDEDNWSEFDYLLSNGAKEYTFPTELSKKVKEKGLDKDIPQTVRLCIGAVVMFTCNLSIEKGIVNGTIGEVVEFDDNGFPVVKYKKNTSTSLTTPVEMYLNIDEEDENVWIKFMPLRLAWSITLHKSQGATIDAAIINLGRDIFECGMAYTALSRVRDQTSVRITEVYKESFKTNRNVLQLFGIEEKDMCSKCGKTDLYECEKLVCCRD